MSYACHLDMNTIKEVTIMDEMIQKVQLWVNAAYSGKPGFVPAPENGKTGWSTMYALTRALQIELGISTPADNFGPGTEVAYKSWGEMEIGRIPTDDKGKRIVLILQGAMYCKGYNPTGFTGTFGEGTKAAVIKLQTDAGLPIRDGKVYSYIFKAFLTMDAYVLTSGGNSRIREMQRDLNSKYYKTSGVQPCDGYYQRGTNKALIYGIQTEEGIAPSLQTGSIGPSTTNLLPTLSIGNTNANFVKLLQYALYVNDFNPGEFNGQYSTLLKNAVAEFQKFVKLPADGVTGKQTWLSLLQSKGDPNRKGKACDCITEVTSARAKALKNAGYETIGRYLVDIPGGLEKKIKPGELKTIFNAGLTVFPIYQTYGNNSRHFSEAQGKRDAQDAFTAAKNYGFKNGTTIYFAVDFDALGDDITNKILPHFKGINEQMKYLGNRYKVGIYGARNVCSQVSQKGWATTSFVSDMSTGFSANLGYPLPKNWAFDQISTISVGSGDSKIEIDNNIKSGLDNGASGLDFSTDLNQELYKQLYEIQLLGLQYTNNDINEANKLTTNYYRRKRYESLIWTLTSGQFDKGFEEYVISAVGENSFVYATDPVSKTEVIDFPHLMATLSALLYANLPLVGTTQQDLAGWGGDLFTVAADVYKNRDKYSGDNETRTYKAAYDLIGTKTSAGNFDNSDFLGDIDAINIAQILLNNKTKPILNAVQEYYNSLVFSRYKLFYKNKFNSNENNLRLNASNIMIGDNPDITAARVALRGSMQMEVPYYTEEEGEIIANAFADKILDLVASE